MIGAADEDELRVGFHRVEKRRAQRKIEHGTLVDDHDVRVERRGGVAREGTLVGEVFVRGDVVVVVAAPAAPFPASRLERRRWMVDDCTGWDMRLPAVAISARRCAARPVGAHINTLRPIARHSRTAMCVANVFPCRARRSTR